MQDQTWIELLLLQLLLGVQPQRSIPAEDLLLPLTGSWQLTRLLLPLLLSHQLL